MDRERSRHQALGERPADERLDSTDPGPQTTDAKHDADASNVSARAHPGFADHEESGPIRPDWAAERERLLADLRAARETAGAALGAAELKLDALRATISFRLGSVLLSAKKLSDFHHVARSLSRL